MRFFNLKKDGRIVLHAQTAAEISNTNFVAPNHFLVKSPQILPVMHSVPFFSELVPFRSNEAESGTRSVPVPCFS